MRELRRVVVEAIIVAAGSIALAFVANAISQDGLIVSRNYFERRIRTVANDPADPTRGSVRSTQPAGGQTQPADTGAAGAGSRAEPAEPARPAEPAPAMSAAAQRLAEYGIGIAHIDDVKAMLSDPLYNTTKFIVDARDDAHYQAGHLPGAYQLDHYRADRYLPELLPVLMPAEQIIVYCGGGTCEDSELAAIDLINNGVPQDRIAVYLEGYREWVSRGEMIEKGERGSGNLAPGQPQ